MARCILDRKGQAVISPVIPTPTVTPIAETARSAAPVPQQSGAAHDEAAGASSPVGRANPTFQFDPAAGVLVIQFRDDSGKVALSIPSQQQINAYATDRVEGQQPSSSLLIA